MNNMQYSFLQHLSHAKMLNRPVVIVEGKDDVALYEKIAEKAHKTVKVVEVQYIKDIKYTSCEAIIAGFKDHIAPFLQQKPEFESFILGIIDRDIRPFRGNMPNCLGLYVLPYYSIESFFCSKPYIIKLLQLMTAATSVECEGKTLAYLWQHYQAHSDEIYLAAIQATIQELTNSKDTTALFRSAKPAFDANLNILQLQKQFLANNKTNLDNWAVNNGVQKDDMQTFVHGKYLLPHFVTTLMKEIKNLSALCNRGNANINICMPCANGDYQVCYYKSSATNNVDLVTKHFYSHIDVDVFSCLIQKFQALA